MQYHFNLRLKIIFFGLKCIFAVVYFLIVVVAIIGTNKSIGTIIAEFPIKEIVPFG